MHLTLWLYPLHLGSYSYQGGILPFLNYHLLNFERTEKEIPKIKEWATTSSLESLEQEKKNTIVDGLVRHWHQSFLLARKWNTSSTDEFEDSSIC